MDKSHVICQIEAWILKTFYNRKAPVAMSMEDWDLYDKELRKLGKFNYWFIEEFPRYVVKVMSWFDFLGHLHAITYYIRNRYFYPTNVIRTGLPPGYNETDELILHGMFQALVDFVEIQEAHMEMMDPESRKKFGYPKWRRYIRIKPWRNREAGIAHLQWAMNLVMDETWGVEKTDPQYGKTTSQGECAKEIYALFKWWTEERPNRPDPHAEVSAYNAELRAARPRDEEESLWSFMSDAGMTPEQSAKRTALYAKARDIEAAYDKEDDDNLCRLIRIRKGLWT